MVEAARCSGLVPGTGNEPLMIDVSIIIVSWNAKAHLARCLESIRRSRTRLKLETIVVDNGSSDQSSEMVEQGFPEVRLVRAGSNLGFARANNLGIELAQAQHLCLMNSDVEIFDETLDELLATLNLDESIGMIGPSVYGADREIQYTVRRLPSLWDEFYRCFALDSVFPGWSVMNGYLSRQMPHRDQDVEVLAGCFWLVRYEAARAVGGLDEGFFMYAEDVDWCRRFRDAGWRVVFHPASKAMHYGGASTANAPVRFAVEMQKADLRYWLKHHSRPAAFAYLLLSSVHHSIRWIGHDLAGFFNRRQTSRLKAERSRNCLAWLWLRGVRMLLATRPVLEIQASAAIGHIRKEIGATARRVAGNLDAERHAGGSTLV